MDFANFGRNREGGIRAAALQWCVVVLALQVQVPRLWFPSVMPTSSNEEIGG
jgi:hypothetical protein